MAARPRRRGAPHPRVGLGDSASRSRGSSWSARTRSPGPGDAAPEQTALSVVVLAAIAIGAGVLATWLVARSRDPLTGIRRALGRVQEGDFGARVTVDDGSEVGLLQSGFNAMVAGLAERELLREVFGRHVGEEVARQGASRETAAPRGRGPRGCRAVRRPRSARHRWRRGAAPEDVVRLITPSSPSSSDVVGRHGGWINKFEGDARRWPGLRRRPPTTLDPRARRSARRAELRHRLHVLPGVDAGIGVRPVRPWRATSCAERAASSTR